MKPLLTTLTRLRLYLILAAVLSFAFTAFCGEPTNRAAKVYEETRLRKMSVEDGKRQCLDLIANAANLPERIEAAEKFAKISYLSCQFDNFGPDDVRRINEHKLAIATTLPVLGGLDEIHKHSLPALSLGMELSKTVPEVIHAAKKPKDVSGLTTVTLACLEKILDADERFLVPPDKVMAADEDLELEKQWAKRKLAKLKKEAESNIIRQCWVPDDDVFVIQCSNISRIMQKYPDNAIIQEMGRQQLQFLTEILRKNIVWKGGRDK